MKIVDVHVEVLKLINKLLILLILWMLLSGMLLNRLWLNWSRSTLSWMHRAPILHYYYWMAYHGRKGTRSYPTHSGLCSRLLHLFQIIENDLYEPKFDTFWSVPLNISAFESKFLHFHKLLTPTYLWLSHIFFPNLGHYASPTFLIGPRP